MSKKKLTKEVLNHRSRQLNSKDKLYTRAGGKAGKEAAQDRLVDFLIDNPNYHEYI